MTSDAEEELFQGQGEPVKIIADSENEIKRQKFEDE